MSETVVRIVVDSTNAKSESLSAERALDRFGASSQRLDRNLGSLDLRITSVTRSMRGMRTALGGLGLGLLVREFADLADKATQMDAKLRLATDGTYSYARAQKDVHDIAKRTRSELTSTTTLYAKMTQSGKALKATQESIARATETVTKSLKISGATTGETQSTVLQLGQALASGRLNGDEFRSLTENAPRLMQLLADAIGKPRGELKKLASDGKLTSDILFKALSDKRFTDSLDQEFKRIPPTFSDAMTAVKNAAIDAFGAFDKGGQFSKSLYDFATGATSNMASIMTTMRDAGTVIAGALKFASDNASLLGVVLGGVVASKIGLFVQSIGVRAVGALVAFRNANLGAVAGAMALARISPIAGTATVALGGLRAAGSALLGVFGGPLGAAVTAVGFALTGMAMNAANTANILSNTNDIVGETDKLIKEMTLSGNDASKTVTGVGREANDATPKINAFAGAVGNAAQKLYDLADARRADSIAALEQQRTKLSQEYSELYVNSKAGRRAPLSNPAPQKIGQTLKAMGRLFSGEIGELLGFGTPDSEIDEGMRQRKEAMERIDQRISDLVRAPREGWVDENDRNGPGTLTLAPGTPKKHKKTDAEREAERAAKEAERMRQATEDLWQQLEDNLALASKMPLEAEKYNVQLDLQKASGKTLAELERERKAAGKESLDVLLSQTRAQKLLTDMKVANDDGRAELEYQRRRLNMTDKQAAVEEAAWEWHKRALTEKVDLTESELKTQLDIVKARAGETYEIMKQNSLIKSREALLREYSPANAADLDRQQIKRDRDQLFNLVMSGEISPDEFSRSIDGLDRALSEVNNRFANEFGQNIDALGSQFKGEFGKAISKFGQLLNGLVNAAQGNFGGLGPIGSIIDLIGKNGDGSLNSIGSAASKASQKTLDSILGRNGQKSALLSPLKSLSEGFGGFKTDMKKVFTGKGPGSVAGAIGNTLGKAAGGFQMGQMADGLMKSLGIGSSKTGASIGGAIGGVVGGPLGSIIGGFGGGLLGGLFKKKRYGTANISLGDDGYLDSSTTGNKAAYKQAATGAASSVISGLDTIAEALGGSLTGNPNISIGQYKGKWRVSDTGRTGKLKGKYSDVTNFGKDGEAAAIEYAVKTALQKGVLTGITDFSKRVLSAAQDLDRATNLAAKYENIVKELARIDDPIGAPLKELNKEWTKLREEMIANKATASELANVDRFYMLQRQKMLEDSMSNLNSLRDKLMGEGSGLSSKAQLDNKLAEFAKFQSDIAAGKSVDTSALSTLGDAIWDLTKDTYGTSTAQSQNIRNQLLSAIDGATSNINSIYAADNTGNAAALDQQTQLLAAQTKEAAKQTSLLEQLVAAAQNNNASLWTGGSTVNGKAA